MSATLAERLAAKAGVATQIAVHDLPVDAMIGINPDEKGRRQRLLVSVEIALRDATGPAELDETIDYREIVAEAHDLAADHIGLIEHYARLLGERCMALGPAESATVSVKKPGALDHGLAATVVRVDRVMPADNVLPFVPVRRSEQHQLSFAFQPDINDDAQQKLAGFLRFFLESVRGVALDDLSFDRPDGMWNAKFTLGGKRSPRIENSAHDRSALEG